MRNQFYIGILSKLAVITIPIKIMITIMIIIIWIIMILKERRAGTEVTNRGLFTRHEEDRFLTHVSCSAEGFIGPVSNQLPWLDNEEKGQTVMWSSVGPVRWDLVNMLLVEITLVVFKWLKKNRLIHTDSSAELVIWKTGLRKK